MSLKRPFRLRRTLAFRLTIWYAMVFSLSFLLTFLIIYLMITAAIQEDTDQDLISEVREFSSIYQRKGADEMKSAMLIEAESEGMDNMFLRLLEEGGKEFATTNLSRWGNIGVGSVSGYQLTHGKEHVFETLAIPGRQHNTRISSSIIGPGRILQIGKSLERDDRMKVVFRKAFGIAIIIILALAVPSGFFMAKRALGGVEEVTRIAKEISKGHFDRRVRVSNKGEEIENLSKSFNVMVEKIQVLLKGMREITDNIAHDLRSPITRIRGLAETTVLSSLPEEDYEDMAGSIVEECDRLLTMINTMLDISEVEAGALKLDLQDIDIVQIIWEACDLFQPVAEDNRVTIIQKLPLKASIRGDATKIQRALSNLIDNAIKYTDEGGCVTVSVSMDEPFVVIYVSDTGRGISDRDLPRIFDRFYRGDQSRSLTGTGLGLTLARAISRVHGGDILVDSVPGKGSTFTMTLPQSTKV